MAVSRSSKCLISLRGFPVVSARNDLQQLMPANRSQLFSCFVQFLTMQLKKSAGVLKDSLAYRSLSFKVMLLSACSFIVDGSLSYV
jgi:hypothetical protein